MFEFPFMFELEFVVLLFPPMFELVIGVLVNKQDGGGKNPGGSGRKGAKKKG